MREIDFDSDGKSYLEMYLPEYLQEDLDEFKRILREEPRLASSYWGELYSSINMADVEDEITTEQARYLRDKYLGI